MVGQFPEAHSPYFANYRTRVLSVVLNHAKDMGLLSKPGDHSARGIKALKYEKTEREPWPENKVAKLRKAYGCGTRERPLFELLLGTGQRVGKAMRMQWGHIDRDGAGIRVRQGKTGRPLWIPITPHLRAALDTAERSDLFILPKDMTKAENTGPCAYRSAAQAMRATREAAGRKPTICTPCATPPPPSCCWRAATMT